MGSQYPLELTHLRLHRQCLQTLADQCQCFGIAVAKRETGFVVIHSSDRFVSCMKMRSGINNCELRLTLQLGFRPLMQRNQIDLGIGEE